MKSLIKRRLVTAFAVALVVFGCGPLTIRDEAARDYVPLRDATFVLHQNVTVPSGMGRVFFQRGTVQPAVSEYRPHCELTVRNVAERPQTIEADRFSVKRVTGDTVHVVTSSDVVVAVNVDNELVSGGGGDGGGRQMKTYVFFLHSDRQPDVLSLVCGGAFDMPAWAKRPSLQDIANALGEYGTLELP